ncbi:MAG: glycerate kinase [Armatimonadota bacterium]
MKVVICPDSFKGSITSIEVAQAVARGIARAIPVGDLETVLIPVADGGEGTVDALLLVAGGDKHHLKVRDPLMREIKACYGLLADGQTAVVEMAAASGLYLLSDDERNPLVTSTYGTGELILEAIQAGARKIIIGIGGSATNDGGAGAMSALGARFLDSACRELPPGGATLAQLDRIDMSGFVRLPDQIRIEVACDVTNRLCGNQGASAVYGPQKGATPQMVEELDSALAIYASVIRRDLGKDIIALPGAGAAGGLGAGLSAFLNAQLRSGIDIVLDSARFDEHIQDAALVITGEGRIDAQTASGKTIAGILKRASKANVPVVAIAGSLSDDLGPLHDMGLTAAFGITSGPMSLEYAMENAASLIEGVSESIMRLFVSGQRLG